MKRQSEFFILLVLLLGWVALPGCNPRRMEMNVKYSMEGCFGSEISEITVYSMRDSTIAILKTKGQKTKQVTLPEGQHPALSAFIYEFKLVPDKNCFSTTEENYAITYFDGSREVILKKKYNCFGWDGFTRLKNNLFNFEP